MAFPARWLASMRSRDYELGITSFDSGHFEEAIGHFQRCIEASQDSATVRLARFYVGECYGVLGAHALEARTWERAEEWLSVATELQPTHADVKYRLAFAKRKRGLPAEALTFVALALEINPNYARAILLQAILWYESGRRDDAISRIRSAGLHDSTLDFRLVQQALSAHSGGESDTFLLHMERALQERSSTADVATMRGDAAFREGKYQEALSAYSQGLEAGHAYADLHCKQGQCFLELGMPEDALESLMCALEINPNYLEAQYHSARALMSLRRNDEARSILLEIVAVAPEHSPAKELLDREAA